MQESATPVPAKPRPRQPLNILASDWRGTRLLSYGLALLVVALLIVGAYYLNHPAPDTNSDTPTYLAVTRQFLSSGDPVDAIRTPGYPLFIALLWLVGGSGNLGIVSLAQGGLFILATLEVYLLAWLIWKRPLIGLLVGLVIVSNIYLLSYIKPVIVEPLALWLATSLALVAVWYTQRVSARRLWLVVPFLLGLMMTRPEWAYLPVPLLALLLFIAARRERRKLWRLLPHALAALVVLYGLLGLFIYENSVQNGFTGITELQGGNLVGKILQYHMQDEAPPQYADVMKHVDAFLATPQGQSLNPNLLNDYYPAIGQHYWALGSSYAIAIIETHPVEYLLKSLPAIVTLPIGYYAYSKIATSGPFGWELYQLQRVARLLYYVEALFFLCAVVWVAALLWRRTTRLPAVEAMSAVVLIVLYQLLLDAVGAYVDLRRFRAPIEPLVVLVVWGTILAAISWRWQRHLANQKRAAARLQRNTSTAMAASDAAAESRAHATE